MGLCVSNLMTDLENVLYRLAGEVERLAPCHRDPERFHSDKSEIAAELREIAGSVSRKIDAAPYSRQRLASP